ncbi:hypothetical protein B0O80DRAFT_61963 [Mortierella sp. GBAus27b]|nr:hypothetical protein B0O80DRAFT_61963 [Mortierella sp. GBAus27b]
MVGMFVMVQQQKPQIVLALWTLLENEPTLGSGRMGCWSREWGALAVVTCSHAQVELYSSKVPFSVVLAVDPGQWRLGA